MNWIQRIQKVLHTNFYYLKIDKKVINGQEPIENFHFFNWWKLKNWKCKKNWIQICLFNLYFNWKLILKFDENEGFKCDTRNSRCVKGEDDQSSIFIPFHLRVELLLGVGKDILCPDNQTSCKDTQTCCLVDDTTYGCCPIREALCCDDKVHW